MTIKRTAIAAAAFATALCWPAAAQQQAPTPAPEDLVQGSVKSWMSEAPDPGFEHNQYGRNIGQHGSVPDYGNYCGPLPGHVCHGAGYSYVLFRDPFSPTYWRTHTGNAFAQKKSAKKGWPLQTLRVVSSDGSPVAHAEVSFFETGYRSSGIKGQTDANGVFQVAVKHVKRSHRFIVHRPGFKTSRLDIVGRQIQTAEHEVVLADPGLQPSPHRVAVMGGTEVPSGLAKDYRRAEKALNQGDWDVAIAELRALVERWPVGTLEGSAYEPRALLIQALQGAGETALAESVDRRAFEVVKVASAG